MTSLLLGVFEQDFGITQNGTDWCLKLLANIGEKHPAEPVVFIARWSRFHHRRLVSRNLEMMDIVRSN
jgi:hypothetical protein